MKLPLLLAIVALCGAGALNIAAEEQFSWRTDAWVDKACASEPEEQRYQCKIFKPLEYLQKYHGIIWDGQVWIKTSCPNFVSDIDSCAYQQIDAMLKPGWPTLDHLDTQRKAAVQAQCPRGSLSPVKWRECVEKQLRPAKKANSWTDVVVTPSNDGDQGDTFFKKAQEYAQHMGNGAEVVAAGKMRLANRLQLCGQRPTVLDPTFGSESAGFDGFIVINPMKMRGLPAAVQQWLYARGCARQFRGTDAAVADCFATARGKRQGWMSAEGAEQVCDYLDKSSPTPFPERCAIVRKCVLLPSEMAMPNNRGPATTLFSVENVEKPSIPSAILEQVMTPEEVYKAVAPSVYLVVGSTSLEKLRTGEGVLGSAVAVAPHVAITNCHVVKGQNLLALANEKDEVFLASVLTEDEATDRCFVSVKENLIGIAAVRPANELAVGERVYSIGNPSGLMKTLGEGIVSGLRHGDVLYVQTTAPISHGSSGGALVDSKGALVGITTMMLKDSQNLNFAIAAEDFWK